MRDFYAIVPVLTPSEETAARALPQGKVTIPERLLPVITRDFWSTKLYLHIRFSAQTRGACFDDTQALAHRFGRSLEDVGRILHDLAEAQAIRLLTMQF